MFALDLVAGGKREEVECPAVLVDGLGRLAGSDGNGLGQMQLEVGGMSQEVARGLQSQRVHHQLPGSGRTGNQGSCAPGQESGEIVRPGRRGLEIRLQLGFDAVQQAGGRHPIDDDGALLLDDLGHRRGAVSAGRCSTDISAPPHLLSLSRKPKPQSESLPASLATKDRQLW